jgi:hypothetical protein
VNGKERNGNEICVIYDYHSIFHQWNSIILKTFINSLISDKDWNIVFAVINYSKYGALNSAKTGP